MRTSSKLALVATLLAAASFASAEAIPPRQNIELHPAYCQHDGQSVQHTMTNGRAQNEMLHKLAGPGSMAG
ncbi:hypothetical protein [Jeongeupia sp. USM3]|uniref:hypothetical protein n=1 Tax=Jeongeupia sp. USM3 TaxID=1906741 RepID=UPI00089DD73C|nr:hypothetical protein [Jeongeupia sp. USM3]AOY00539.1 hypothetical protein BJP62_08850 [Jeongeupia sp. USM3]